MGLWKYDNIFSSLYGNGKTGIMKRHILDALLAVGALCQLIDS